MTFHDQTLFMNLNSYLSYIEFEKRYSPNTLLSYKNDLEQFSSFLFNHFQIDSENQVTQQHIRSWLVQLLSDSIQPKSISRKLSTIKSFFRYLHRNNTIANNPALSLTAPKLGKRLPFLGGIGGVNLIMRIWVTRQGKLSFF